MSSCPPVSDATLAEIPLAQLTRARRTLRVGRAAARFCLQIGWAPLHEVPLPNGRRADILALRGDGGLVCIEVKSGSHDFLADAKWQDYRAYADALFFAVDEDFPTALLPGDVGLIVACGPEATLIRDAPAHPLHAARRRSLLHRFATLAAQRLVYRDDPASALYQRTALRPE